MTTTHRYTEKGTEVSAFAGVLQLVLDKKKKGLEIPLKLGPAVQEKNAFDVGKQQVFNKSCQCYNK